MKGLVWLVALATLGWSIAQGMVAADRHVLLVSGSTEGYLSPCGCVKPMSGGLRRRVTAIRQNTVAGRTTVIDTGKLVVGRGRQDEMKAEAVAETMALVKVAAINYGLEEARLGEGMASSLDRLSGGALVASGLVESRVPVKRFKASGPFLIAGIDPRVREIGAAVGTVPEPVAETLKAFLAEAAQSKLVPVLMTRGDLAHAEELAQAHPGLRLIVCTMKSAPLEAPRRVGETLIVTAGEHAKSLVRIEWDGEQFTAYKVIDLGPEFADDDEAQEAYSRYLGRVASEGLLDQMPRGESPAFAGNASCGTCHAKEARIWKASDHAKALKTLEHEGHDRDPDCVACHVVGLTSVNGFKSRQKTPGLTDVGCESCHGPGKLHAMNASKNKMPRVGRESCAPCHNTEHSPTFDFDSYWEKIKH